MKKTLQILVLVCILFSIPLRINAQPGCPLNFPFTETFCFTNNSGTTEFGNELTDGCQIEICVKIKPKLSCYPECNYASPDGWYSTYCTVIDVGNTNCINIPSTHNPITSCWDVEISMKIVGHSQTLTKDVNQIDSDGAMYGDDCEQNATDFTVIKLIPGGGYNYDIRLRRVIGG